jgi:hypothetical protein
MADLRVGHLADVTLDSRARPEDSGIATPRSVLSGWRGPLSIPHSADSRIGRSADVPVAVSVYLVAMANHAVTILLCPVCDGDGDVLFADGGFITCATCDGEGVITEED